MEEARKEWYRRRVAAIHERVTAYDVLRLNGIALDQIADDRPEQISCPFHGEDKKPSARIYPADNDSHSHVWCYVCQEPRWDAVGLWRKFNGDLTFSQALASLEKSFSLETPEVPKGLDPEEGPSEDDVALEHFKRAYMFCESRLISQKATYKKLGDMAGYLSAGSVLDKVRFRVDARLWTPKHGEEILDQLLERIREKVRQCPDG
jgi:hypothetical protein